MKSPQEPGVMICPGCATPNEEGQDFCTKCRAPLTWHATTDPMGTIFAEGYAAGRAIDQAQKPIVIMGLWLWMGPLALIFGVLFVVFGMAELLYGLIKLDFEAFFSGLLVSGLCLVVLFFSISMLYKGTRNYLRQRNLETGKSEQPIAAKEKAAEEPVKAAPEEQLTCLACGQAIPENTVDCPACGWAYR